MLRYNCEPCKFSSKIKTHYTRHLKTNKHLKNTQNVVMSIVCDQKKPVKNQKNPEKNKKKPKKTTPIQNSEKKIDEKIEEKNITETFECHFCNTIFKTKYIKRRHELHRCKNNDAIINRNLKMKNNEINKLKNELTEERKNFKKQIELLLTKVGNTTINGGATGALAFMRLAGLFCFFQLLRVRRRITCATICKSILHATSPQRGGVLPLLVHLLVGMALGIAILGETQAAIQEDFSPIWSAHWSWLV